MLSRSKRIFGIAILSAAAAAAVAIPAHASSTPVITGQLMKVVQAPLCLTTGTLAGESKLGVPLVEELLPQLGASCAVFA
ncbi:hypothetical protein ACWDRB_10795 [Nonomuraea sp. NPDC003707]|uniref:hypothetical protein n=1 Tax=Nonomuraea TaxID=83681 RepID=UPI00332D98B4